MKNNKAECVLLSPKEYLELMNTLEDLQDYVLALEREAEQTDKTYTFDKIKKESGISNADLQEIKEEDLKLE